jgi:hemolysin III
MTINQKERFSALSHFSGAIGGLLGLILLLIMCKNRSDLQIVSFIYGLSAIFLFSASGLYHTKKKADDEVSFWRKLDHLAIFFLIAGTYTVISYIHLSGYWKWGIISAQWILVFLGIIFKFLWIRAPRILSTTIYLLMGWMAILSIKELVISMSGAELIFMSLGAFFYSAGAIIYAFKKPDILPNKIGFHGVFHVFILLGGFMHFVMIVIAINGCTNFFK